MNKLLFLLSLVFSLTLFTSCSSDDDKNEKDELQFVQVIITSDDAASPSGIVSLFYLGDSDITDLHYTGGLGVWDDGMVAGNRSDGKTIFPVSKVSGDKMLTSTKDNYSVKSFYWYQLSSMYGTPLPGKKYAVFVQIGEGNKPKAYKVFTIDKNKKISVHLPSAETISKTVEANWKIEDY